MPFYMEIFRKKFATSEVCCSRGDREGVSSLEIFVWFETVLVLGLANLVKQLRYLACRRE